MRKGPEILVRLRFFLYKNEHEQQNLRNHQRANIPHRGDSASSTYHPWMGRAHRRTSHTDVGELASIFCHGCARSLWFSAAAIASPIFSAAAHSPMAAHKLRLVTKLLLTPARPEVSTAIKLRVAGYYFDTISHADDIVADVGLAVLANLERRKRH